VILRRERNHPFVTKTQDATMMNSTARKSVFGVASSRIQASRIVNHLANAGFSRDDISVSFPDRDVRSALVNDENGTIRGNGTMAMGLSSEWLGGAGAFPLPRFKNFMAGGPISGVLCGASIAPASLENMDYHQGSSVEDHWLICLQADDWREADAARKIFQAMGASNITVGGEKASRLLTQTFQCLEAEAELPAFS
jgi:hypothetical protein